MAVLIAGLIIALAVGAFALFANLQKKHKYKQSKIYLIAGIVFIVLLAIVPMSIHTVDTGEVAVVKHMGEAKNIRTAGTYFDFWLTEKYDVYDAKVQNIDVTAMAYSKDAQSMDIAMTVQFQIVPEKSIEIASQYGTIDVLTSRIESVSIEKTKSVLSSYSAMEIIQNRSAISPKVEEVIKEATNEEFYINITAVVLTNIDFSDAFEKTVEDKMIAEQEKLKAEYEKETAIVNAEKELEVAKLAAQAKIEEAKAKAQSEIEVAKAEARAIQLKSIEVARALGFKIVEEEIVDENGVASIEYVIDFEGKSTEEIQVITDYLKYVEYLAKWDGKLPTVMGGDSATVVIPNQGVTP